MGRHTSPTATTTTAYIKVKSVVVARSEIANYHAGARFIRINESGINKIFCFRQNQNSGRCRWKSWCSRFHVFVCQGIWLIGVTKEAREKGKGWGGVVHPGQHVFFLLWGRQHGGQHFSCWWRRGATNLGFDPGSKSSSYATDLTAMKWAANYTCISLWMPIANSLILMDVRGQLLDLDGCTRSTAWFWWMSKATVLDLDGPHQHSYLSIIYVWMPISYIDVQSRHLFATALYSSLYTYNCGSYQICS